MQAAPGGEENGEMGALGVGWEEKGALHAWCRVRTLGGGEGWCLIWAGEGWREKGKPAGRMNAGSLDRVGYEKVPISNLG